MYKRFDVAPRHAAAIFSRSMVESRARHVVYGGNGAIQNGGNLVSHLIPCSSVWNLQTNLEKKKN